MNRILLLLAVIFFALSDGISQGLEDDNMVLFMKANVLFESGRYDEAVRMYNRILSEDKSHSRALYMRSKAKFELGALRGTKNDIMLYIEMVGVNKEVIKLMAKTELELSHLEAAEQYVKTAMELDPFDDQMLLLAGDIFLESGRRNDACEHYSSSADLGNSRAVERMKKRCRGYQPRKTPEKTDKPARPTITNEEPIVDIKPDEPRERTDGEIVTLEEIVQEAENTTDNAPDNQTDEYETDVNASQNVDIDSKLNITIEDGLGDRRLISKPSIFMLSDQDGLVVIDLCIAGNGRVSEATFNRTKSTIYRSSLTSLALRKAKEFVFENASGEQCGTMTYNIKS